MLSYASADWFVYAKHIRIAYSCADALCCVSCASKKSRKKKPVVRSTVVARGCGEMPQVRSRVSFTDAFQQTLSDWHTTCDQCISHCLSVAVE